MVLEREGQHLRLCVGFRLSFRDSCVLLFLRVLASSWSPVAIGRQRRRKLSEPRPGKDLYVEGSLDAYSLSAIFF